MKVRVTLVPILNCGEMASVKGNKDLSNQFNFLCKKRKLLRSYASSHPSYCIGHEYHFKRFLMVENQIDTRSSIL